MNLIPARAFYPITNYYCTWKAQGKWLRTEKSGSAQMMRDRIDAEFLFGEDGILPAHPVSVRSDLLVVLDDGWDVARGVTHENDSDCRCFGSLVPDAGKFPELAALTPGERLKALSEQVKALGYAGLGLWVPSNYFEEDKTADRAARLNGARAFWTERGRWCAEADIRYLKVDWGWHGRDVEYRALMTEAIKAVSPHTLVEHVVGVFKMPYDPEPDVQCEAPYRDFQALAARTAAVSDVYRTYDVVDVLATATTLMRVAAFFDAGLTVGVDGLTVGIAEPTVGTPLAGLVNIEDEAVIGAALGMSIGVMRHVDDPCYGEVRKALCWQRFAPPFRMAPGQLLYSEDLLCDSYFFDSDPNAWPYVGQKTIKQYAPARVSRCAPLPEVVSADAENAPFVLCSKHPETGAFTVAALSRTAPGRHKYRAPAAVTAHGADADAPVGIFGSYESLSIVFGEPLENRYVYAQNLAADEASDITERVRIQDNILTLDGALVEELAASSNERDASENGLVLKLWKR